jgi:hypothetical protein
MTIKKEIELVKVTLLKEKMMIKRKEESQTGKKRRRVN